MLENDFQKIAIFLRTGTAMSQQIGLRPKWQKKPPGRSKVWMLDNVIVIREKEILTVDQSVLWDKVENNERWEEIGDKRKMNPWQFHFEQKLCS